MENVATRGERMKKAFSTVKNKVGAYVRNLAILVKMQLKEKLNWKRKGLKGTGVFDILLSVFVTVLKFAMVTAMCGAFIFVSQFLNLFSADKTVPPAVMSIIFTAMLILSVVSCTAGLTKAMYYSRDNAVLLTLPATPSQVYLSKLVIFFIFELKRNLSFIVPLFLAYFFLHSYSFIFYPWMLVSFIFLSFVAVSIGALLSIPAMYVANFFRQYKYLQIGSLVVIVGAAIALLFVGVAMIPSDIDILEEWPVIQLKIRAFLVEYEAAAPLLFDFTRLILGDRVPIDFGYEIVLPALGTFLRFLFVFGTGIAFFTAGMLIVRPLFYSMASKPFEYMKKQVKPKKNIRHPRRVAALGTEFLVAIKNPSRMFQNVGIIVAIPLLTFFLNKVFLAMDTRDMGDFMIVAFNALIILLLALNANCSASSIFSRDGRSSYLIKSQPSKYLILILGKLLPDTSSVCLALVATFAVLYFTTSIGILNLLLFMVGIGAIYLAHMLYSAELDLMNPQAEIYASVGSTESNPNETKSTVSAFIVSFVVAAAMLLLLLEGEAGPYIKLALVGIAVLIWRAWLFFTKIRLYYKEK